jgi:LmbE family N-acetylglucosaminyl deacetylase
MKGCHDRGPGPDPKAIARGLLRRAAVVLLRARSRPYPIDGGSRCLVVSPHQDDSTLGCGGTIILKRLDAAPVDILYLTDGSGSHPGHPTLSPGQLSALRRDEEMAALGILGLDRSRAHFLGARDGTLPSLDAAQTGEFAGRIAEILREIRPTEIFLPCRADRSAEHEAGFRLVLRGVGISGLRPRILQYPVWSWWDPRPLFIPALACRRVWRVRFKGYAHLKLRALGCYASQSEPTPPWTEPRLPRKFLSSFACDEEFFLEDAARHGPPIPSPHS